MVEGSPSKVTAAHLKREAYLYVRQSTLRQVLENTESTQRQYALRQRAIALGWPTERVHVIDCDLGQSGASAADRAGFQELVTEVSLGHAGIVLGLEVSRLARNSADWQRLLELCALSDTLILDEDGLYNCNDFNDRLLLGLNKLCSQCTSCSTFCRTGVLFRGTSDAIPPANVANLIGGERQMEGAAQPFAVELLSNPCI